MEEGFINSDRSNWTQKQKEKKLVELGFKRVDDGVGCFWYTKEIPQTPVFHKINMHCDFVVDDLGFENIDVDIFFSEFDEAPHEIQFMIQDWALVEVTLKSAKLV